MKLPPARTARARHRPMLRIQTFRGGAWAEPEIRSGSPLPPPGGDSRDRRAAAAASRSPRRFRARVDQRRLSLRSSFERARVCVFGNAHVCVQRRRSSESRAIFCEQQMSTVVSQQTLPDQPSATGSKTALRRTMSRLGSYQSGVSSSHSSDSEGREKVRFEFSRGVCFDESHGVICHVLFYNDCCGIDLFLFNLCFYSRFLLFVSCTNIVVAARNRHDRGYGVERRRCAASMWSLWRVWRISRFDRCIAVLNLISRALIAFVYSGPRTSTCNQTSPCSARYGRADAIVASIRPSTWWVRVRRCARAGRRASRYASRVVCSARSVVPIRHRPLMICTFSFLLTAIDLLQSPPQSPIMVIVMTLATICALFFDDIRTLAAMSPVWLLFAHSFSVCRRPCEAVSFSSSSSSSTHRRSCVLCIGRSGIARCRSSGRRIHLLHSVHH